MILTLKRKWLTNKSTIGELSINGKFFCFSLEDVVRKIKIPKETAIPAGTYEIIVSYSNNFKKFLPLLLKVPGFEGVRIHAGNKAADTNGCILTGMKKGVDEIYESKKAFDNLFKMMTVAIVKEKVYIRVI